MKHKSRVETFIKICLFILFISFGAANFVFADEVWISPVGTDGTGSGTAGDPYVRTTAVSFDALIGLTTDLGRTGVDSPVVSPIPPNSTIHLMAGTFLSYGYINPLAHWKIRGAGVDVTFIQQQPWMYNQSQFTNGWLCPMFGSANSTEDGVEISDMTIDCNLQAATSFPAGYSAVSLSGAEDRLTRLKAINWGSTSTIGGECFIFVIGGDPSRTTTNAVIDDCEIGAPAPVTFHNGADGFAIFGGDQYLIDNAEIINCVVSGITTGTGIGQPAYFAATTAVGIDGLKIAGNRIVNTDGTGFYSSCGSLYNCTVENNLFINVDYGVSMAGVDACSTNNYIRENIQVNNNFITVKDNGVGIILSSYLPTNNLGTNFVIEGNNINAAGTGTIMGAEFADLYQAVFQNNILNVNDGGPYDTGFSANNTTFASLANNKSSTGLDSVPGGDQTIVFVPTSGPGWYRLTYNSQSAFASGTIRITRDFQGFAGDNTVTDTEFNYSVTGYTTDPDTVGTINMVRSLQYQPGGVDAARIGAVPGSSQVYLDVHVSSDPLNWPITIKTIGGEGSADPQGGQDPIYMQTPLYEGTTNMPQATKTLWFGRGLSTSDYFVAGTNGTRLNDDAGLILDSALNVVDPAHGGLGTNASGWAAGLLPYTTGTGIFGSTPISSFGLGLISAANSSSTLTNLGLPSSPALILTNNESQPVAFDSSFTVNGNVGIGTSSPSQKLSVFGNATVSGSLSIGSAAPNGALSVGNASSCLAEFLSSDSQLSMIRFGNTDYSHLMYFGIRKDLGFDSFQFYNYFGDTSNPMMVINSNAGGNGNVGIGTNAPSQRLTVVGNISASGTNFANYFAGDLSQGSNYNAGNLTGTLPLSTIPTPQVATNVYAPYYYSWPLLPGASTYSGGISPSLLPFANGCFGYLISSNVYPSFYWPIPVGFYGTHTNLVTKFQIWTTNATTFTFNVGLNYQFTNTGAQPYQSSSITTASGTNVYTLMVTNSIAPNGVSGAIAFIYYSGNGSGNFYLLSGSVNAQ
jgi:hypothetical protein